MAIVDCDDRELTSLTASKADMKQVNLKLHESDLWSSARKQGTVGKEWVS